MSGAAWIVRKRMAIPPAQKKPQKLTRAARREEPDEVDYAAADVHPDGERDDREEHGDDDQRQKGGERISEDDPARRGAASMSRLANPPSKSRATPKPVKTPLNAADWRSTKTNWNAV